MPKKSAKSAKSSKKSKAVDEVVEKVVEKLEEKSEEKIEEKPVEEKPVETSVPDSLAEPELSEQTEEALEERPLEEEVPLEKKNRKLFWMGMIVMGVVLILTGWFLCKASQIWQEPVEEVVEAEDEVVQLEKGEISLDVFNGSGVAGIAGRTATIFEDLGYEIYEIGNADTTEGNQLYINPDIDEELLDNLWEDVKEELDIEESSGELEDSTASARIILGR